MVACLILFVRLTCFKISEPESLNVFVRNYFLSWVERGIASLEISQRFHFHCSTACPSNFNCFAATPSCLMVQKLKLSTKSYEPVGVKRVLQTECWRVTCNGLACYPGGSRNTPNHLMLQEPCRVGLGLIVSL